MELLTTQHFSGPQGFPCSALRGSQGCFPSQLEPPGASWQVCGVSVGSPGVNPEHTAADRVLDRHTCTRLHWASVGSKHPPAGTVVWVGAAAP